MRPRIVIGAIAIAALVSCDDPRTPLSPSPRVSEQPAASATAVFEGTARAWAGAADLNGRILVVGGGLCLPNVSGCAKFGQNETGATEEYDPATNAWTTKSGLNQARWGLIVAEVGGRLYAIGGTSSFSSQPLATVEEYDPVADVWTQQPNPMRTPRWKAASAVSNGIIYTFGGGATGNGCLTSPAVEAYDPSTDVWTAKASMPTSRWGAGSVEVGGTIYVLGGAAACWNIIFNHLATLEAYDPAVDGWTSLTAMNVARWDHASVAVNGKIYAIGGYDPQVQAELNTVEEYDPSTNQWSTKASMPTARTGLVAVQVGGLIYAIGGFAGTQVLNIVEVYDPATDSWTSVAPPPPLPPVLSVSPLSLDFISVEVGQSKDLSITVKNMGGGTLTGSVSTSPPFSIAQGSSFALAGTQSSNVVVRFTPTAEQPFSDAVSITSTNDGQATVQVAGVGVRPNQAPTAEACVEPNLSGTPCSKTRFVRGIIDDVNRFPPWIFLIAKTSDPDGDPLTLTWTVGSASGPLLATGPRIASVGDKLGPGQHTIVLTADDQRGGIAHDQLEITVSEPIIMVHGTHSSPDRAFGTNDENDNVTSIGEALALNHTVIYFDYSALTDCNGIRPSVPFVADAFAAFVENSIVGLAPPYNGKLNVLAHSMGGLVARAYMAGLANRPYNGAFKRIAMAATPNYGISPFKSEFLSWLNCGPKQGDIQEEDLKSGSQFIATLDRAWKVNGLPIPARNVLTIAGVYNPIVESDGGVEVASAMLPQDQGTHVAYNTCAHNSSFPFRDCSIVKEEGNDATTHPTFQIVSQFFRPGYVPHLPPPALNWGVVMIRFVNSTTGSAVGITNRPKFSFELANFGIEVLKCNSASKALALPHAMASCPALESGGIASFSGLPAGPFKLEYTRTTKLKGTDGTKYEFNTLNGVVIPGRPIVYDVMLSPK